MASNESQFKLLKSFLVFKCSHKFHKKCISSMEVKGAEEAPIMKKSKTAKKDRKCPICVKFDVLLHWDA